MRKQIEIFNGKAYEQVFVSPDADMKKACGELCCFAVITPDGPRCMNPADERFDGCGKGHFIWKEFQNGTDK